MNFFFPADLVLEWRDLLDGDLVAGDGVLGRRHHAVRALAQELKAVVAGTDLEYIE